MAAAAVPKVELPARDGDMAAAAGKIVEIFQKFDTNKDGVISRDEMANVLRALSPMAFTDKDIDALMKSADVDKDGVVAYQEFVNWIFGVDKLASPDAATLARHAVRGCFKSAQWVHLRHGEVRDLYDIKPDTLGEGGFGQVHMSSNKATGKKYAIKVVPVTPQNHEALETELTIMKQFDHPNIAQLYEAYEDKTSVYYIMELCQGGELFDFVAEADCVTEKQVAHCMQQMFGGVRHMHERGICHRDLKPENFLFKEKVASNMIQECQLKIIDHGGAIQFTAGQPIKSKFDQGTLEYQSPERLKSQPYYENCDVWSLGVIMFIMFSGEFPFAAETEQETKKLIESGRIEYDPELWDQVSGDAKVLLQAMLEKDPKQRLSAADGCLNEWIARRAPKVKNDAKISGAAWSSMKSFCAHNQLKKAAMHLIARRLNDKELADLAKIFSTLDTNHDGSLTFEELGKGLAGMERSESLAIAEALKAVMDGVDSNWSGKVNYTEFLAATMDSRLYQEEKACRVAFQVFDRDNNGFISKKELAQVLHNSELEEWFDSSMIRDILTTNDKDADGNISFDEFLAMMRSSE